MIRQLTALIEREGDGDVSLCPELDVASPGKTIEAARESPRQSLELFLSARLLKKSPDDCHVSSRNE